MTSEVRSNLPPEPTLEFLAPDDIRPGVPKLRKHGPRQMAKLRATISELGFLAPILVDEHRQVIAGYARLDAAKDLGLERIGCLVVCGLDDGQKRALAIADNRLPELAEWDMDELRQEIVALSAMEFNVEAIGFETAEIDLMHDMVLGAGAAVGAADPDDVLPPVGPPDQAVSRVSDVWTMNDHRLICGDARDRAVWQALLGDERGQMAITDAPYNVRVQGHVSGLGKVQHREFAMASGEMSQEEYTEFLTTMAGNLVAFSIDGSMHFFFMDWRHIPELQAAGSANYASLENVCIWNKTNAGMGSLYRSKHELVFVYKKGKEPHINNVQLGRYGRYRTNVWDYAGANAFGATRADDLSAHPTVKPVALVADAIRDCSKRGGLILDPFMGSGTTILAAERTGRRAAGIEIDPRYVDVAVSRWQQRTGGVAILAGDGRSFAEIEAERRAASTQEVAND